jgi:hypothetical protein
MKRGTIKRIPCFFALCVAILFSACRSPTEDIPGPTPETLASLTNTVFAGEDGKGNWATFAFIDEAKVYYFPDNALHYNWTYTYNKDGRTGEIKAAPAPDNSPGEAAPGAFTLSADGKTIAFSSYLGTQGERYFKRVRNAEGEDEEVPFTLNPLPPNLDGTVWAATGYRTRDWTTLTITAANATEGSIQVSHSADCTSFARTYTGYAYNTETTLAYIGPFIITGNDFTFLNFYGHGAKITLKRMR